jgi:O-antigen/teichoic acid export membrane protein
MGGLNHAGATWQQRFASEKSLGKVAKKGVLWSFCRESVTAILFFPSSMILARLLSPREFGIAAAATFFVLLAARLSELGFNAALVRSKTLTPAHLSTVFVMNLAVGVVSFAVLTAIAPLVGAFYDVPDAARILPVAATTFLIGPFGAVPAALITRNMRYREAAFLDWLQGLVFAVASVALAWLGLSYMSVVYARVIAAVVQSVSRMAVARWRPSLTFSTQALRDIFSIGAGIHTKRLLDYTAQNIDNLVVGKLLGMTALGLYDKAFSTMNRFLARMNTAGPNIMFRVFAIIHEDPDRFKRAYQKILLSTSLLGLPVFTLMVVTAPHLIVVLFGPQWRQTVLPFQILCVVGMLKLLNTYASSAIQAAGFIWSEVWRQTLFVAFVVLGIALFRTWGVAGAAIGVLLANTIMSLLLQGLLLRVTGLTMSEFLRPQLPAALCSAVLAALLVAVEYLVVAISHTRSDLMLLVIQAVAGGLYYALFMLLVPLHDVRTLVRDTLQDVAPRVARVLTVHLPSSMKSSSRRPPVATVGIASGE